MLDERKRIAQILDEMKTSQQRLERSHEEFHAAAVEVGSLFESLQQQVEETAGLAARGDSSGPLVQATRQMQEMNRSYNLQYLALQNKMRQENRQFAMISNVVKTKHDTASSVVRNIR